MEKLGLFIAFCITLLTVVICIVIWIYILKFLKKIYIKVKNVINNKNIEKSYTNLEIKNQILNSNEFINKSSTETYNKTTKDNINEFKSENIEEKLSKANLKEHIYNNIIRTRNIDLSKYIINQNKQDSYIKETTNEDDFQKFYRPRRYLITLNELRFYNILLEIAEELNFILFAQVSLYNILEVRQELDFYTRRKYFHKIAQKSIDFVLVDKKDCRIRTCIELDDSTHKRNDRIKRDEFVNKLFEDLNINLIRYKSTYIFNKEDIKNKILEKSEKIYY